MRVYPRKQCFLLYVVWICTLLVATVQTQKGTPATTDPDEVRALNSLFLKWGITFENKLWNISGEPCSGAAIDSTTSIDTLNTGIKCDCSYNSSSTCHINQLTNGIDTLSFY
ncbi:probable LRR receptor-like serine/threonine-protein kinase At1g56130 [Durio zibethinus]|uniref:Probable LRR receptor-like serine/threonine-protein kinase At1g56130 n=1 Tax=Durio zibethinus TaxID=66656 RepID=A0A6P5WNX0_DURZI|nr:probable LRR receptor-like serine/threonine-protein kinase At1g56130 [Durio zibethinus]